MVTANKKTVVTYEDGTTREYDFKGEMTIEDKNSIEDFDDVLSISVGSNVTSLGESVFDHDTELSFVFMQEGLKTIREKAFWFSGLKRAEIPEGVETIEWAAFSCCENMKVLTLPDSLTSIGEHAFDDALKLKKLVIPKGLTKIPDYAFDHCESLTSLTLHDNITEIGDAAFRCSKITSLILPSKISSLGSYAFVFCQRLSEVEYKSVKYTSLKSLYNALTENGVTLGDDVFSNTALS